MGRDRVKIALVLSLVFNLAVAVAFAYGFARRSAAQGPCPSPAGIAADSLRGGCCRFARQIGLPQERALRFSRLMAGSSGEMAELRGRLHRARRELVEMIGVPQPDERMVMAKVDEISAIQGEIEKRLVTRLLSVNTILLPEERERLMRLVRCKCMPVPREVTDSPERVR